MDRRSLEREIRDRWMGSCATGGKAGDDRAVGGLKRKHTPSMGGRTMWAVDNSH